MTNLTKQQQEAVRELEFILSNKFFMNFDIPFPKANQMAEVAGHELLDEVTKVRERDLEILEGMKKRMDVGNFGVDSVSFPSGKVWTQEKRNNYNEALDDVIKAIKGEE